MNTSLESSPALSRAAWSIRLWLALLLGCAELLTWGNLPAYTLLDWAVRGVAYLALATFLLDIVARYRIRDMYDAMAAVCAYALLAGVLLTPEAAFSDFPRTFVTRLLGAYNLTGAIALGTLLVFTAGNNPAYRRRWLAMLAWVGFYWGTWMRWTPIYGTLFAEVVPLSQMFLALGAFAVLVGAVYFIVLRTNIQFQPQHLRLPFIPALLVLLVLLILFFIQAWQGNYQGISLFVCGVLWIVCMAILWFRRSDRADMLLKVHFPPVPLGIGWIAAGLLLFGITMIVGYSLPLIGTAAYNQLWLMEIGYGAVGFFWLPLLASVIAIRGIDRQMRARQLDPF